VTNQLFFDYDFYMANLDIDKAEGGLMVLFFGLVFSVAPSPLEIFLPTPLVRIGLGGALRTNPFFTH